jgi:N-acetylneuraminic acid mutarotase
MPQRINGPGSAVLDGKLYICGGLNGSTVAEDSVYRYDPATDTWDTLANMPAARAWGSAVAANGVVYFSGGQLSGVVRDQMYMYRPDLDQWFTMASLPVPLRNHVMINIGGEVYSFGGALNAFDNDNNNTGAIYRYDPLNVWHSTPHTIPTPRAFHGVAEIAQNVVMVFSGQEDDSNYGAPSEVLALAATDCPNTKEVRDPSNLEVQWYDENDSDYAPAVFPGTATFAASPGWIDNRMYIAGGWINTAQDEGTEFHVYDPIVNRWIRLADVPVVHGSGPRGVIGTDFYVGADQSAEIWRYDTIRELWLTVPDMPEHVVGAHSTVYNGQLYVTNCNKMYVYDPDSETWSLKATGPDTLVSPIVVEYRGLIYVFEGFPASTDVYRYNPATDSWETLNDFPVASIGGFAFVWNDILFCSTGKITTESQNDFYEYDPDLDAWNASTTISTPPNTESRNPAHTVHNNRLHLVCGVVDNPEVLQNTHQVFPFTLQRI